ncbi:MAG: transcriptional regulator NrdR [Omnitrophica WOR_2 bacterium GWA2_47_8]|nr:MAG: transcriptional regulator NrdR [Omnitrophica WOR_2 bacterium GWA2_47_8]
MKCPYCANPDTQVIETRETENLEATRRRRECLKCERRFTTYEKSDLDEIIVVKKDGRKEKFDRRKILNGMLSACEKRVTLAKLEEITDEIEAELRRKETAEVDSKTIGKIVMRKLRAVDKIAFIRFASVYQDFESLESFKEVLEKLEDKK